MIITNDSRFSIRVHTFPMERTLEPGDTLKVTGDLTVKILDVEKYKGKVAMMPDGRLARKAKVKKRWR